MSYPKWKYHQKKEAVVVNDEAAEAALGKGWKDAPFPTEEPAPEKETETKND